MEPRRARGRAYARAALAGNPSDGYGGAVLAVTVGDFAATAVAEPAERAQVEGPRELVEAAVARFPLPEGARSAPARITCSTTIPRQVGLGGSSAIVIATLRALCELHGLALAPDALARAALAAETEELGLAAGPQTASPRPTRGSCSWTSRRWRSSTRSTLRSCRPSAWPIARREPSLRA